MAKKLSVEHYVESACLRCKIRNLKRFEKYYTRGREYYIFLNAKCDYSNQMIIFPFALITGEAHTGPGNNCTFNIYFLNELTDKRKKTERNNSQNLGL